MYKRFYCWLQSPCFGRSASHQIHLRSSLFKEQRKLRITEGGLTQPLGIVTTNNVMEVFWSISLQKWWKSNFSLQSQYIDKQTDNENKEYYDHRNFAANVYGVGWRKLHVCKKSANTINDASVYIKHLIFLSYFQDFSRTRRLLLEDRIVKTRHYSQRDKSKKDWEIFVAEKNRTRKIGFFSWSKQRDRKSVQFTIKQNTKSFYEKGLAQKMIYSFVL